MIVSTEQVITTTKKMLVLKNTEHDAYLEMLINQGATHMNNSDMFIIKCAELEINDCHQATLPDFFQEFLGASFTGDGCSGCCAAQGTTILEPGSIETVYRDPVCCCPTWFVSKGLLTNWFGGTGACSWYGNYFNINGNTIMLPSTTTATSIKVWYRSRNVDDDGLVVLNEDYERALSCYASWMFAVSYWNEYANGQRDTWEGIWCNQKAYWKGVSQKKQFNLDKRAIWQIMNAIIYDGALTGVYGTAY